MGCCDNPALPLKELKKLKQKSLGFFHSSGLTQSNLRIHGQPVQIPSASTAREGKRRTLITITIRDEIKILKVTVVIAIIYAYWYKLTSYYTYHCNHTIAFELRKSRNGLSSLQYLPSVSREVLLFIT